MSSESWAPKCLELRKGGQYRTRGDDCQFTREGTGTSHGPSWLSFMVTLIQFVYNVTLVNRLGQLGRHRGNHPMM